MINKKFPNEIIQIEIDALEPIRDSVVNFNPFSDMIKFEIESLGPIRDSVIDFNPFLIFSGDSNTGKSYALMAVY